MYKYIFYVNKKRQNGRIRELIWKAFKISSINLIFVEIEFYFSYGNLYEKLNDLGIATECLLKTNNQIMVSFILRLRIMFRGRKKSKYFLNTLWIFFLAFIFSNAKGV